MRYCTCCGNEVYENDVFCPNCGNKIVKSKYDVNYQQNNVSDNKPLKGGAVGFLLTMFLQIAGLILCCILGDKKCIKGSIIAIGVGTLLSIIFFICVFMRAIGMW